MNNGVEGAEVAFSSGGATVITNAAGYYNTTVAYGWNGTSVVTKQGWICGPECSPVCFTYPIVTSNIIEPDHILTLIILGIEDQFSLPKEFTVLPAFPNPFNPSTTITYGLNTDSKVSIQIFNITGRLITTLINAEQASGWHSIVWNATNQQGERIPAGLYLSKITSGNEVKTSKLMLLK
jgi:hypothetical protein